MLYFKQSKAYLYAQNYLLKELIYKIYKLFRILKESRIYLNSFFLNSFKKIFVRNLCIYSYKNKRLSRTLKLSRIPVRNLNKVGIFFGYYKIG